MTDKAMDAWLTSEAKRFKHNHEQRLAMRRKAFVEVYKVKIARRAELADKIKWGEETAREAHEYGFISRFLDEAWATTLKDLDNSQNWGPKKVGPDAPSGDNATESEAEDSSAGEIQTEMSRRLKALVLPRVRRP